MGGEEATDYRQRLERVIPVIMVGTRRDLDVSQSELARRMGWTRNMVANLESGRRSVRVTDFLLVAKALRVDPVSLLHRILRW
jgi:transcriptional regulator with XRE-family HTH domain